MWLWCRWTASLTINNFSEKFRRNAGTFLMPTFFRFFLRQHLIFFRICGLHDQRIPEQEHYPVQYSACFFQHPSGSVQYVRHCGGGPLGRVPCAGIRRVLHHFRHVVYGAAHRHGQRHQRHHRPVHRRPGHRTDAAGDPHFPADFPDLRRPAHRAGAADYRLDAGHSGHQARAAGRRGPVHEGLPARNARAGAVQLRQRRPQRRGRLQAAPVLSGRRRWSISF